MSTTNGDTKVWIGLKEGVKLEEARPETLRAIQTTALVFADQNESFIVTAIKNGKHGVKSYHRFGLAFDCRSRHLSGATRELIAREMRWRIGPEYDVVVEHKPPHYHVEWDPK